MVDDVLNFARLRPRLLRVRVAALAMTTLACGTESLVPTTQEPLVHVLLTADAPEAPGREHSAFVLTANTPIAPRYRSVQRFEMRRLGDGALVDWRPTSKTGTLATFPSGIASFDTGNVMLAENGATGRIGRRELKPNDEFTLEVDTEGRTVRGRVSLPGAPAPTILRRNGLEVVAWPRVSGAAGYFVRVDTDRGGALSPDTSYVIRRDEFPGGPVQLAPMATVIALDDNLYHFLRDTTLARAGIEGGYGILGAYVAARIPIPFRP